MNPPHRSRWAAATWIAFLLFGCQQVGDQPVLQPAEPTAQVQSALGPCSLDTQGIGDAYAGWVALKTDGSMWMNRAGGDVGASTLAMKVEQLGNDVESIATVDGESLTFCAIKTDHTLWCWGANNHGQVGDGSGGQNTNTPTQIPIPGGNVASVSTGGEHACAVTIDGRLFCWGMNEYGQIGDGMVNGAGDVLTPTEITSLGDQVAQVSAGFEHTCALMKDDSLNCWGHNVYGEIGDGTSQEMNISDAIKPTPVAISSLGADVAVIAAGGFYTCIIKKSDGSLWCWGDNTEGHLATGDTNNQAVPTESTMAGPWLDVDTGVALGCGVKTDGSAWCWGRDELGQLGTPSPVTQICPGIGQQCSPVPQAVQGVSSGAVKVSVKDHGACARLGTGDLMCWGAGNFLDGSGPSDSAVLVDFCDLCEVADCTGATPVCLSSGSCGTCVQDDQCPAITPACLPIGACAECTVQNSTACLNTTTPMCDPATNTCVACITDEDCVGTPTPVCDDATKSCRECATDADCPDGTPACQTSGICGECSITNLTLCAAPLSVCEPASGTCVNCITDADCTDSDAPNCDTGVNLCRECLTDDHCTLARPVCDSSGTCSSCQSDADCPATQPACTSSGSCEQCSPENTTLCTGDAPLCDEDENECVQCVSDDDCDVAGGELCDLNTKTCGLSDGEDGGVGDGGSDEDGGDEAAADERYGACAGCVTARSNLGGWQAGVLVAALALALRRRRRNVHR
jgi:Regulator of chromosome condensation (RCC1) repeat